MFPESKIPFSIQSPPLTTTDNSQMKFTDNIEIINMYCDKQYLGHATMNSLIIV